MESVKGRQNETKILIAPRRAREGFFGKKAAL